MFGGLSEPQAASVALAARGEFNAHGAVAESPSMKMKISG
jgi:hypothetical protein